MKKINFQQITTRALGIGVGAVAGKALNRINFIGDQKPGIRGLIKIVVGAILPEVLGKGKNKSMIENAGAGIIAIGAVEAVEQIAPDLVKGVDDTVSDDVSDDIAEEISEDLETIKDDLSDDTSVGMVQ